MKKTIKVDVAIIGGGSAGTIAAIACARNGVKTLLVEKNGYLGGSLTAAGVGPMMSFHAGETQVVKGIADELVERMKASGYSLGHMEDFVGYCSSITPFDAEGLKYTLETMAQEAGVILLYHTTLTGCTVEDKIIKSVQLHSKNGFFDVEADVFLDCTADADLSVLCGIETTYGRESDHLAQPMTMNIKVANVDRNQLIRYVKTHTDDVLSTIPFERLHLIERTGLQGAYSLITKAKKQGKFDIDRDMVLCFETNTQGEFILNMSRVTKKSAIDPFELTAAEIEGRKQARQIVAFMKENIPGFEHCHLLSTGPNIGIRESRKIKGQFTLRAEDLVSNRMFDDAIAMGGYPIDIHSPDGSSMKHQHLKKGSWYAVPYRSLVTNEIDNLIVAGRCISATHEACAAIRVTPIVMAVGQAAGTAAAQCIHNNEKASTLNTEQLIETLKSQGQFLQHYKGIS